MSDPETPKLAGSAARERSKSQSRNPAFELALGARIRAARVAAKMSQGALGETLGITLGQVHKYEKGQDRVSASTLNGIAAALGIHPGSFFDDDIPVMPPQSVADVRDRMRLGERIQRVRDPAAVKHLLALADLLAGPDGEQPANSDETP